MFILQGLHVTQAQICEWFLSPNSKDYSHLIPMVYVSLYFNIRSSINIIHATEKTHGKNYFMFLSACSIKRWPTFEATGARGNPEFYSRLGQSTRDTLYLNVPRSQASANFIRPPGVSNASLMIFKMMYSSHQAVNYPLWGPLRIYLENVRSLKAF